MTDELPDMMTTAEVAKRLRRSDSTIRRMCARGELSCVKLGRNWLVPVDEVRRLLQPVKLAGGRELPRERLAEVVRSADDEDQDHARRAAARAGSVMLRGDAPVQVRIIG
jgi:excisionase family DNA binding protein